MVILPRDITVKSTSLCDFSNPFHHGVMKATLGIDFGTNSVRALLVDCATGKELGTASSTYPSGRDGVLLDPANHHLARQHPADYFTSMTTTVKKALALSGLAPGDVLALGVDTTGSSPIPVDAANRALADSPSWKENLDAQCWLWKDHTSHAEAARITELASRLRPQFLAKCGGTYSSEWFWAKIWHCLKVAPEVFDAAHSWVELSDFIPSVLAGVEKPEDIQRGVCAAGHKAMYSESWGGLPDEEFLNQLDPKLASLRGRLYTKAHDASNRAGHLCPEWAGRFGLAPGIPIAIGEMDVHYGAIGCGVAEGTMVKVVGTSTCDCLVVRAEREVADIPGICGIVPGAILPGFVGIEAGQSAVGDIFKWWVEGVCQGDASLHQTLTAEAASLRPGQSGLLALDWNNGNRTILVDQLLTGLLLGQTLYTTRAEIYRALIEATAFGARMIIERIREYGVPIERIVCAGGIAEKNPLLMQIYADVTGCEMRVTSSSQACALGAAVAASVVAGAHPDFASAQAAMTSLSETLYKPVSASQATYERLFQLYRQVHDAFGGVQPRADLSRVMKDLLQLKQESQP
jgi:L-ribulokinase